MRIPNWKYSQELGELQEKFEDRIEIQHKDMKILKEIKDLKAEIKDAETKDALACTIICTNVSKRTFEFVKGPDTSFKIMEKLKSLYRKKKFSDVQYWMKKIYLLKASTLIVQLINSELNNFYDRYRILNLAFSPTFNLDGIKLINAIASKFLWNIMQLDIKEVYLKCSS
ncbi:hypothetical protein H8356DRAFT_1392769 [Neocallimastix lanati (nom. inval.)]|nr:hypothetical protein H8356DRAFT_1392769 [Neocallimastix sp. JGI-2020a]